MRHEWVVSLRNDGFTAVRQHTHQLLVRLERLAELEVDVSLQASLYVGDHGGVVVAVVPWPRCYSAVVVVKDPLQSLYVVLCQLAQLLLVAAIPVELALVIVVFPRFELLVVLLLHGLLCFFR